MGVYCTDRLSGSVFGVPSRVWALLGDTLRVLDADQVDPGFRDDGYVPSWLARDWGEVLFDALSDVVVVARPVLERGADLVPVAVCRRGTPAALRTARAGEQLSVYDTPLARPFLAFAQFCTGGTGFTTTTLRPPAPGSARSEVAVRRLLARSGLLRPSGLRASSPRPSPRPSSARPAAPRSSPPRPGTPPRTPPSSSRSTSA